MKQLIEKVWSFYREFSETAGPFTLFGLFEREESAGRWDLVVSAEWLQRDTTKAEAARQRNAFFDGLQRHLGAELIVALSLVAIMEPDDAFMKAWDEYIHPLGEGGIETLAVTHGLLGGLPLAELRDCTLNGMTFRRVILYEYHPSSQLVAASVAA